VRWSDHHCHLPRAGRIRVWGCGSGIVARIHRDQLFHPRALSQRGGSGVHSKLEIHTTLKGHRGATKLTKGLRFSFSWIHSATLLSLQKASSCSWGIRFTTAVQTVQSRTCSPLWKHELSSEESEGADPAAHSNATRMSGQGSYRSHHVESPLHSMLPLHLASLLGGGRAINWTVYENMLAFVDSTVATQVLGNLQPVRRSGYGLEEILTGNGFVIYSATPSRKCRAARDGTDGHCF
jgi:hypothetical protein